MLEESKVTGAPFDQLIVSWQLAERDAVRECLRSWLAHRLESVQQMPSPSVLFVPLSPGGVTLEGFLLEEVAPWLTARHQPTRSSSPPSVRPDSVAHRARLAMQLEGALAAFVLAVLDGTCLAQRGDRSHIEVSWALARALHAMPQGTAQCTDILLSSPTCHYVARSLEQDPELLIVVVIDITAMTSGNARLQVARVAAANRGAS